MDLPIVRALVAVPLRAEEDGHVVRYRLDVVQ
jgi:hypothetical protein